MIRWIIVLSLLLLVELYGYQAIRTVARTKWIALAFEALSLTAIVFIIYTFMTFDRSVGQNKMSMAATGMLLLILLPKLIISLILLGEDIARGIIWIYRKLAGDAVNGNYLPTRRKFVSTIALGLAAVPFLGLLHGIFIGKFNFRVIRQQLFFDDLPDSFDGFTITQISDLHSGSLDNAEKIDYAVDLINEQKSDVILFTGDIVNSKAEEMHQWISTFNKIEQPAHGKFSVLGNHDYGEYLQWDSEDEKRQNFEAIKDLHRQIGFKLMLNENQYVSRGAEKIAIVGVENWGHNFKKAGDLLKASQGLQQKDFKILMTHDPSHWEYEVKDHPGNFHLTLSGHTHGFQFGIEIPGFLKWSPVQYVYKQWAGLYENLGRYIYVNRGLGYHAYPGRVGIWPEITVIELKKRRNTA